jgi:hypothetical protein
MSLKNYEPALFELIERAFQMKAEIKIPFGTVKEAQNLALRLQRLRREMRMESHYLVNAADTLEFVVDRSTPAVCIRPQGYTYIGQVQAALARLPEISPEVQEHELENTSIYGHAGRLEKSDNKESEIPPPTSFRKDNAGGEDKAGPSPQEEALKAFMKKGD